MKVLWIFFILIIFCIYVLLGLHITAGIDSSVQIILTWVIYTLMWSTFVNVFTLGYFWSVIRNKKGPTGLRGPVGERGIVGVEGTCSIDSTEAYLIKAINEYIDGLYFSKTNMHILDEETQKFPCKYLNNKIYTIAGSRQYKIIVANLALENKPVISIINYLKNILSEWFELLYNSTDTLGVWFTDEYADEEYTWIKNPFDEIKKYDVYYWGVTRDFRPLKAEICRSTAYYQNSKIPNNVKEPKLKIIQSNYYQGLGRDNGSKIKGDLYAFRPYAVTLGLDTYYPIGDILRQGWYTSKPGKTIIGDMQYDDDNGGPFMKSLLVAGDVVDPINYKLNRQYRGGARIATHTPICPSGYESMGDIIGSRYGGGGGVIHSNTVKCVPKDCIEKVNRKPITSWIGSGNYALYKESMGTNNNADGNNGYNLFRSNKTLPYYKIKDKCINTNTTSGTKDVEEQNGDLGIGWNGHPYKLEPKYSIFTFLNLVPEGMIVHKGTGRRFYIIHYGGEESNIYNVLIYNEINGKYDNSIQVASNVNEDSTQTLSISRGDERQQWSIVLEKDKKHLKLKNILNKKYLYVGIDPNISISQFSTIDLDNNKYMQHPIFKQLSQADINNGTIFTFISSFGTNLDIIDK